MTDEKDNVLELIEELQFAAEGMRKLSPETKREMEMLTNFSANAIAHLYDKCRAALNARPPIADDVPKWATPSEEMPPLHTQVLVALRGGVGGVGEVLDVACYIGKQDDGAGKQIDRWILADVRLDAKQIVGWMHILTASQINERLAALEALGQSAPSSGSGVVHVVFDGPPSHESGRFIECETPDGRSINAGEWHERGDGLWELRIPLTTPLSQPSTLAGEELVERLLAPTKWCCIFEHEGQMRHGTTDAPFQAATRVQSDAAEIARLRDHIAEQATHAETRIQDGVEMGATVWRIALEDIVRENRAALGDPR